MVFWKKKMMSFDWWSLSKQQSHRRPNGGLWFDTRHGMNPSLNRWALERLSIVHQSGARQRHLSQPGTHAPWFCLRHPQGSTFPIHPSTNNLSILVLMKNTKDYLEQWNVYILDSSEPSSSTKSVVSCHMPWQSAQPVTFVHSPISPVLFRRPCRFILPV